ncbi:MAG TPA: nuclear transport factor 2 family protein [Xanthomonadales bacterium]|nr:nuclear transport factor 2 family protein [Xanthomonadales bacterium]
MTKWVKFKTVDDQGTADMLAELLSNNDVPNRVDYGALQAGVGGVRIQVPEEMLDRAEQITSGSELSEAELTFLATGELGAGAEDAPVEVQEFAKRYTAAWSSGDPGQLAACYAEQGSLRINQDPPCVGREAIAALAQGFMNELPDMVLTMDGLKKKGESYVYRWTLDGTNSAPGGSGNTIHISGFEEWIMSVDGLILESRGHMDSGDYQRQLSD